MAEVARPGMGQDEKDRIGQAEMNRRRVQAGEQLPDEQLDGLTKPELEALAHQRGVDVPAGATKKDILRALRGEPASDEQPGEEA